MHRKQPCPGERQGPGEAPSSAEAHSSQDCSRIFLVMFCLFIAVGLQSRKLWAESGEQEQGADANASQQLLSSSFDMQAQAESQEFVPRTNNATKAAAKTYRMPAKSTGGLLDPDRAMLIKYLKQAGRVLEWGLGESTRIAAAVGVGFLSSSGV